MGILALIILIIFSLVGFAAIFFTTFGTLIILIGAVLYALLTGFTIITMKVLLILLLFYLGGEALESVFVVVGAKKFGASNAAIIGGIAGGIIGAALGVGFLGVGLIVGTLLGIFLGAGLVELIAKRNIISSLKAGAGSVAGRIGSIVAKLVIAIIMFSIIASKIINY